MKPCDDCEIEQCTSYACKPYQRWLDDPIGWEKEYKEYLEDKEREDELFTNI